MTDVPIAVLVGAGMILLGTAVAVWISWSASFAKAGKTNLSPIKLGTLMSKTPLSHWVLTLV